MRAVLLAIAVGSLGFASVSHACLTLPDERLRTIPANGARDVSVDVAVLVDVSTAIGDDEPLPNDLATMRDANGETIAVSVTRVAHGKVEVRPEQPLERGATYQLEVRLPSRLEDQVVAQTMTFTTTSSTDEAAEAPFDVSLQQWVFAEDVELDSCSHHQRGTCVAVPDDVVTEVRFLRGQTPQDDDNLVQIVQGAFIANLGVTADDNFRCLQLRRVHSDGGRGEPVVVCADEAQTFELFDNDSLRCTARGIEHEGRMGRPAPGCAVQPGATTAAASLGGHVVAWLMLLGLGLLRRSAGGAAHEAASGRSSQRGRSRVVL